MTSFSFLQPWSAQLLGILRIVTGLLFIQHGTAKFFGIPVSFGEVPVLSLYGVAGMLEIVGGVLFIIGLATRPVAFLLSGLMAFAYFLGHASKGPIPLQNGGELAIAWCFTFLYYAAAGAGAWSVDGARTKAA
jgi:putative oxidoreductase